MKQGRDPQSGKRVLRFLATSALVVAPTSAVGCGGANQDHGPNVVHTPEPEKTNVDRHEQGEEHTNVDEEAEHGEHEHGEHEHGEEHTNVDDEPEPPHTNVDEESEPE
ncbi:MAG: hypothetical protein R3B72_24070 [Polyangiaceae bacterium]